LPPSLDVVVSMSGASPLTVTDSATPAGAICRLTTAVWPSRSSTARVAPVKPCSSDCDSKAADANRHAIRAERVGYCLKGIAGGLVHGPDRDARQDAARRIGDPAAHHGFLLRVRGNRQ
jgi:hypothetical protein